jgi:ProP effector
MELNKYVRSDGYLLACTEGAIRIDVNGDAAGTVSAKHAAHAQKVFAERERWKGKKEGGARAGSRDEEERGSQAQAASPSRNWQPASRGVAH